ncbi:alpha,alpha-trehalose-phosphate synthase (UDP-forming) [Citreimonas salinaria]|uniref:Trehalose 6-phosphate synthase n=1 Tax=Citreimonas salinaria TaxID=321339 RepID=A0A1H3LEJ5_9RHOB|nr:trehalose-6-phosphate synthase [Citreimonas salinaria]SDY62364.1 trehalose 6-phosphate synthase [Citreimonas salinaria]
MTGRLIVLSNRIPTGGPPSGGLVVAIHELLAARGGLWIGSADEFVEVPSETLRPIEGGEGYDKAVFDLTEAEHEEFYLGYANSVLWPLCHHRTDLLALDRQYADSYAGVNARVARMLAQIVEPEDTIWVHDYHFLPIALELRKLGVTARVGLFLHIPFPNLHDIEALPERDQFYFWLAAYDLVGLQTQADVARCLESYRTQPSGELMLNGRVKFDGDAFQVRSFPIGIDGKAFKALAEKPLTHDPAHIRADARLILGVDRLDYSKGIPNRVRGFGTWLEKRKPDSPRATLLQITPPSRETVPAYQAIAHEVESLVGRLNGQYSELDWTPIRLIERAVPRETLAPLYRQADIALVTPLADGMNLVAKEFVAAQDPEDPGVLILSQSAGAAEQMTEALIVNPHDAEEVADAIERAFMMPLDERRARHEALLQVVQDTDIFDWGASFLDCLNRVERRDGMPG